jgi:hypothetical protein
MLGQIAQPIGQGSLKLPASAPDDDHIEELLLLRQVALDLDHEGRAAEEIG